jgi:hypothetical protein
MIVRAVVVSLVVLLPSTVIGEVSALSVEEDSVAAVKQSETALARAREQLTEISRRGGFRTLGFESPGDSEHIALQSPLASFDVRLSALRAYESSGNPAGLFTNIGQVIYLVAINEQVRSLVRTERALPDWKPIAFGSPEFARNVAEASRPDASSAGESPVHYIVRVPALNAAFVGRRRGEEIFLTAVRSNILGMHAGETRPAREVFRDLAVIAREVTHFPT